MLPAGDAHRTPLAESIGPDSAGAGQDAPDSLEASQSTAPYEDELPQPQELDDELERALRESKKLQSREEAERREEDAHIELATRLSCETTLGLQEPTDSDGILSGKRPKRSTSSAACTLPASEAIPRSSQAVDDQMAAQEPPQVSSEGRCRPKPVPELRVFEGVWRKEDASGKGSDHIIRGGKLYWADGAESELQLLEPDCIGAMLDDLYFTAQLLHANQASFSGGRSHASRGAREPSRRLLWSNGSLWFFVGGAPREVSKKSREQRAHQPRPQAPPAPRALPVQRLPPKAPEAPGQQTLREAFALGGRAKPRPSAATPETPAAPCSSSAGSAADNAGKATPAKRLRGSGIAEQGRKPLGQVPRSEIPGGLENLLKMGFERAAASRALHDAGGDAGKAASMLLAL